MKLNELLLPLLGVSDDRVPREDREMISASASALAVCPLASLIEMTQDSTAPTKATSESHCSLVCSNPAAKERKEKRPQRKTEQLNRRKKKEADVNELLAITK